MAFEYEFMGQKIRLEPDDDLIAVRFEEPAPHSTRASVAAESGLGAFHTRLEIPGEKFTILRVAQTAASRGVRHTNAVKSLKANKAVARVAPVFKMGDQTVVATDRVLVGFKEKASKAAELLKKLKYEVLEKRETEFLVQLPADTCPFEASKKLAALGEIEYAEPDFVTIGKHVAQHRPPTPNRMLPTEAATDPLLNQQYAPKITKAIDAWHLQVGDPTVRIAVLDEGVDPNHEDLKAVIVGSYDGTDDDAFQEPNDWDAHGTACAGLAAGIPNNNLGIRGIGGGCSILAIRIAYSSAPNSWWVTSNSIIARSIDWAWKNGAAVLSNSWGGGTPSNAIVYAFERARIQGRDGKGCVIIIAAGNDSGPVTFPGTLPNVLTVSASNEYDQFKTKTSSDGENWWGSCFGPEIDVAAPGVHNMTTDISGTKGYTNTSYIPNFNGTSSSTPIVAGAAGLILSANKNLTELEVRTIIKESADKVGDLPYVNGRNDQFGHGRLNVLKAIQKVLVPQDSLSLEGTIIQHQQESSYGAAYFLQTDTEELFLLRRYTGDESAPWPVLEAQSLTYLSSFVGSACQVQFARKQETSSGTILWGVSVQESH